MEWYVQDALDFIEFATGDASTEWGAKRAQLGHPEPFQLEYLAFGNENEGQDFLDRYLYLAQQIKAKYPEMKLVGSAGRGAAHGDLGAIWQVKWAMENVDTTYAVDEHLYKNADYYTTAATRYDVYDRSSGLKVFAGEYACRADNKLKSALADANFMAGFERNADLVTLACYAPLFAKYNYSSWAPNLIWFDNTQVVGMPTYYTHLMYGNNMGDYTIENTLAYCDSLMNHGSFGFYTDGVAARFYDFQVVSNKTGEVIAQKTAQEMLAEGTVIGGNWSVDGGALVQSSLDETAKLVLPGDFEDYTVTFKVTKTDQVDRNSNAGLLFNYVDEDNFYVLQGNEKNYSRVVVRHTSNGFTEGTGKPDGDCTMFVVGNEVEVKLVNDGLHFYGFVMNDPNANNIFKEGFEGLRTWGDFITATPETKANATVSFDRESEEIIVKLINYSDLDHPTLININNAPALSSRARRIVMQNDDMNVGNDLENPTNIAPVEDVMDGISGQFTYTMPKHSFTVLRISVKDDINNILSVNDPEPITTKVGIVPELPAMLPAVNALLTGTTVSVEWETRDDSLYSLPGIYEISGSVAESAIRVTQTIIVEE